MDSPSLATVAPTLACPSCRGPLTSDAERYECSVCGRRYPVVCGIPDFRLTPDPYISFEDEYAKVRRLADAGATSFEALVRVYWRITSDVPQEMAEKHEVIPVNRAGASLIVAMADPSDIFTIDAIKAKPQYADLMREYLSNSSEVFMKAIPGKKTYTVKAGDTLSKIAGTELKDIARWKEIWDLNRDRVANENLIYPKLVLLMP